MKARKKLLIAGACLSVAATLAYILVKFLISTDDTSGSDKDTRCGVRHEPLVRKYTKLNIER